MKPVQEFLQHNFVWLFLFGFLWVIASFARRYFHHKRTGVVFPHVPQERIRFDERTASGRSLKTWFTKLGGASNCLHVTVTENEVWIRPIFPFNIFASQSDLEHRIAISSISKVQPEQSAFLRRSLILDYRDERGQTHQLSLFLKKPGDFLKALDLQAPTISPSDPILNQPGKLPLGAALRIHWRHLVPLPFFAPFTIYTLRLSNEAGWAVLLMPLTFFTVTFYFYLPFMRGQVRMSFCLLGGVLYMFGGCLMVGLCELLLWFFRA